MLFQSNVYYPDFFTHIVALQSEALINALGYEAQITPHQTELSMGLIVRDVYMARIVEGCNAVSIIILFTAFVLSFFGKIKSTLLFILGGAVIIYIMNITRIAALAIAVYELPQYSEFLHSIIFPLIIYGTVFILWLIWVRIYTKLEVS